MTAAEAAPRLAFAAILCTGGGIYTLIQTGGANPMFVMLAPLVRPLAWIGLAAGILTGLAALLAWRRAARQHAAYAKTGLTRKDLAALTPAQFEDWCAARLREQGYKVSVVGGQSDHGIDLIGERDGERLVVQCKRWLGVRLVGEPQVRDLYGAMHHERANGAMVITTGVFSEPALAWAQGKPIRLWDVDRLIGSTPLQAIMPSPITTVAVRSCPKSGHELVRKVNRRSQQAFMACSGFPACRYTEPI